jgi:putative endonuclease
MCGINQRVLGSSPRRGAKARNYVAGFFIDMYYLYILYNSEIDKYYVGHSSDPWRRLEEHNSEDNKTFTRKYKNWKLIAVFEVSENKGDADKLEKFIKIKLTDLNFIPKGKLAQLVRVPHVRD